MQRLGDWLLVYFGLRDDGRRPSVTARRADAVRLAVWAVAALTMTALGVGAVVAIFAGVLLGGAAGTVTRRALEQRAATTHEQRGGARR